ncbi:hypothetical protein BZL30_7039 [Mycobacterium kansasii]|uniref:Uncharacterized protein n=1 Tax=Mycobacterium kansasii TaxID=1768 RepID=A0A1V3WP70_MYCKA|nr:hypothetical protein BZL30_7039 [Mycobacterium kansasii]
MITIPAPGGTKKTIGIATALSVSLCGIRQSATSPIARSPPARAAIATCRDVQSDISRFISSSSR